MVAIGSDSAEIFRLERKHFPHRHTRSAAVCVRVVLCKCVVLRLWKSGREVTDIAVFSTFSATIKVLFDLKTVIGSFGGEALNSLFLSAPKAITWYIPKVTTCFFSRHLQHCGSG